MIDINQLNKEFENRVRLGIMSVLIVNEWVDFTEMKTILQVTDGNLASHSNALEKAGYIEMKKEFVGKKPKTSYKATLEGKEAFNNHINLLEQLLKK
ncbi:winged helix-turn-helix domain-containing protein [Riemerella anatipestifer]|uniref:Transcriptional regulator n=2 Tax=Riemerella anatipestifer TaxID=34085 RepID=J9R3J7_RIEAN|nr:transcriptional regulator [Riemerella anatipestifer]AFR35003.1 Transcriptional regulator [Riemerella anatipestifer RA-CH-1]AIH02014.1 transcriptional regulator [Riemerella anatipestifer CH3]AQY22315.1 transcriptional regulator [Riemerella anatipestifer]AZZ58137.1 transcriptional regulator [Riemerella anatipestifer]MBT0552548.1 transcriptional regulator [Riemerella anatipestifer]